MGKKKVLVTYPIPREGLQSLFDNFDVIYHENGSMPKSDILAVAPELDGILATGRVDADIINAADKLKVISVYGAGYDSVDVEAATRKGIVVTNIPDAVTDATAELALGLMLAVMRRISECDRKMRTEPDFRWGMMLHMGRVLYGKELGIVGMGRIGRAVAKRAAAFGMRVSYYNRKRLDPVIEAELGTVYKRFDDLIKTSDVISLNMPLTNETRHLIGERELAMMKPTAYIVNTARGAVIDEQALVRALSQGRLAGAGLDVFEREPVVSPELFRMDNVVMTPHIGTDAIETRIHMTKEAAQNIIDFFNGRQPFHIVNPEVIK